MERQEILKRLFKIKKCHNLDISEQLDILNKSEEVPFSIIEFINKYDYKIEDFMEALKSKEFYKSLKTPKNEFSTLKGLSSMLTHSIIEIEKNGKQKDLIVDSLKLEKILNALHSYIVLNKGEKVDEVVKEIKEILHKEGEK